MSLKSKRELVKVVRPRYLKASKVEKQRILDEFTSATGYHRKHAIRVLKNQLQKCPQRRRVGYKTIYRGEVVQALAALFSGRHSRVGTLPGNRAL